MSMLSPTRFYQSKIYYGLIYISLAIFCININLLSQGQEQIPRYIAVLPVSGAGTAAERQDLRLALHNILGASAYQLMKPNEVDIKLLPGLDQNSEPDKVKLQQAALLEQPPGVIADSLRVDGLLYIDLQALDKIYVAAYAQYKMAYKARLYSRQDDTFVWQYSDKEVEREGGISTDVLSFLATAISSSRVLRDAVRLQLTDTLARRFVQQIPQPTQLQKKPKPPQIFSSMSNSADSPFKTGDEIRLVVLAEPDLEISLQLQHKVATSPMQETEAGRYQGRYIVQNGDDKTATALLVNATAPTNNGDNLTTLGWQVAGLFSIDSTPPLPVTQLRGLLNGSEINLQWNPPIQEPKLRYRIERASSGSALKIIANTQNSGYQDQGISTGTSYDYRITPIDTAGNQGQPMGLKVSTLQLGPTSISGVIDNNQQFVASGSPYRIKNGLTIAKGITLTILAGSVLEIADNTTIQVLGRLNILGQANAPVLISGNNVELRHFTNKDNNSRYQHLYFSGNKNVIIANNANLSLQQFHLNSTGLKLSNNAKVTMNNGRIEAANIAVELNGGELKMQQTTLANNQIGIYHRRGSARLNAVSFDGNILHVKSETPSLLTRPYFINESYSSAQQKLEGDIEINWQGLPQKWNLLALWASTEAKQLFKAINEQQWPLARTKVQRLKKVVAADVIQDMEETLYLLQNPLAQAATLNIDGFLNAFTELRMQGDTAMLIWLPAKADKPYPFQREYLYQFFRKQLLQGLLSTSELNLDQSISFSKTLDNQLGSLFLVNASLMNNRLRAAGFIREQPVIKRFNAVTPTYAQYCDSQSPWRYGEKVLDKNGTKNPKSCWSLRLEVNRDSRLYLYGYRGKTLTQLLPDDCAQTGVLSQQLNAQQTLAIPQNKNQQASIASNTTWPFARLYAVTSISESPESPLQGLFKQQPIDCAKIAFSSTADISAQQVEKLLSLSDIKSGGKVQWAKVNISQQ